MNRNHGAHGAHGEKIMSANNRRTNKVHGEKIARKSSVILVAELYKLKVTSVL